MRHVDHSPAGLSSVRVRAGWQEEACPQSPVPGTKRDSALSGYFLGTSSGRLFLYSSGPWSSGRLGDLLGSGPAGFQPQLLLEAWTPQGGQWGTLGDLGQENDIQERPVVCG